jgi:hypothetical protein
MAAAVSRLVRNALAGFGNGGTGVVSGLEGALGSLLAGGIASGAAWRDAGSD